MNTELTINTKGQGLYEVTDQVRAVVSKWHAQTTTHEGLCTLFIRHTSASLTIQENAAPSARRDLEAWLNRLVPENDPLYTHDEEGPDDMPAHIKAILTQVSLSVPIVNGKLALGRWQGIYLWEHRTTPHQRTVIVSII
jgi:secondary thiamine-phosphate synthase enzyme